MHSATMRAETSTRRRLHKPQTGSTTIQLLLLLGLWSVIVAMVMAPEPLHGAEAVKP
jgi:hypothetical protein